MMGWLLRTVGGRNIVSFLLLLAALGIIAFGLTTSVQNLNLTLLVILAITGILFAWLLAISPLKGWHTGILTLFLGIAGSVYYFAQLNSPIKALLNAIRSLAGELFHRHLKGTPDVTSILLATHQLNSQLGEFFDRIVRWGETLGTGNIGQDGLVINLLWALAFWLVVVWAGWAVFRRHNGLAAILPSGAILAGTLNYVAGHPLILVPLVGITLMLMAVTRYDVQERYWVRLGIDYAEDIRLDMSIAILFLSLGFMVTSAFAPSISFHQIIQAGQKVTRFYQNRVDTIAESFGLVPQSQEKNAFNSLFSPGMPRSHLLGSGPELSKNVVMVITTGDFPPVPSMEYLPTVLPRYYWRSATYDIYTGRGWTTSPTEESSYPADQPSIEGVFPITGTLSLVHQTVLLTEDLGGMLYVTGQLVTTDKDYQVAWRLLPPELPAEGISQNHIADEFGATLKGNSYTADSYINTASLIQLHAASGEIPAWIQNRYLALPDNLPERVRRLAIDLTSNQLTPYDQAAAIESYLRSYPYSLEVPFPPTNRDVVDYFLFDLKRGYCDYYATAMVVMARLAGLPARLVTGYATGTYDPVNARYIISEANAHSWVEIYLAGIGWVEFEPTGGLPAIQHLSESTGMIEIPEFRQVQRFNLLRWLRSIHWNWLAVLGGMLVTAILGIAAWVSSDNWRLRRLSPSLTIMHLYNRLYRRGIPLVEPFQVGDTPHEYSSRLQERLKKMGTNRSRNDYFQRGIEDTAHLTNLYTQVVYSPHTPGPDKQRLAIHIWEHLRWRLLFAACVAILQRKSSKNISR